MRKNTPTTCTRQGRATIGPTRGMSFCYALVALGAMLTLGLIFLQLGLNSAKWAYRHYRGQQAFSLAEAAVDRAIWMMQRSAAGEDNINTTLALTEAEAQGGVVRTYQSPTWQLPSGIYRFTAVAPHKGIVGTTEIRAVGIAKDGTREDLLVVLRPEVVPPGPTRYIPAACFKHALFSDHNLTISGNPSVISHSEAGGAGIYANGNINFNGGASVIYGPICATGRIFGTTTQVPADAGLYQYVARIPMPELDIARYESIADLKYTGNKVKFTSGHNASAGTYEDPKIIFVDGSVEMAGNFTGVGMIIATKGIRVTGDCTYGNSNSAWAFLTTGTFTVAGTAQIHGLIYAHNASGNAEFIGHGTPNVFGAVVADLITITGNYTIEWDGNATQIGDLPGSLREGSAPVVETVFWERI